MSTPKAKSLRESFKQAAAAMTSSVGIAAAISMSGMTAAGIAPAMGAVAAASSVMGAAAFGLGKKKSVLAVLGAAAEIAPEPAPEPEFEFEFSVETAAPVKAMKRITLRR